MKKKSRIILLIFIINLFGFYTNVFAAEAVFYSNYGDTNLTISSARGLESKIESDVRFDRLNDSVIHIFGTSTANCLSDASGMNYINLGISNTIGKTRNYKKISVVFDFMLAEDGTAVGFRGRQSGGAVVCLMKFTAGEDVHAYTWNRAALVMDADGIGNTYSVYLNGQLYKSGAISDGAFGFEQNGWIIPFVGSNKPYGLYLDNIVVSGNNTGYMGEIQPLLNSSDKFRVDGDVIYYNEAVKTMADLKADIMQNRSNEEFFAYKTDGTQPADTDLISTVYAVSLLNQNGIYRYFYLAEDTVNVTEEDTDSESETMVEMLSNEISADGWQKRGGLPKLEKVYDDELGKDVVRAGSRTQSYHSVKQDISYEKYKTYTNDMPGDSSDFRFSYKVKSDLDKIPDDSLTIYFYWYVNGSVYDSGNDDAAKLYVHWIEDLEPNIWKQIDVDITITVPTVAKTAENVYLELIVENGYSTSNAARDDFYLADFSLKKWSESSNVKLEIDDSEILRNIDGSVLGYAAENGYWTIERDGAVTDSDTGEWKDGFLDYLGTLNMNRVRLGGSSTNYEFWKANMAPLEDRVPTISYMPATTPLAVSRDGVEKIGTYERLEFAESFGTDTEIVMCTNIWSAMPADIDYSKNYTTSVAPEFVYDLNGGVVNTSVLQRATEDIKDLIRFCKLMPNDAKAVGSDGINWAQKRVDMGHSEPFNVSVWELGNELYLWGMPGDVYVDICNYVIDEIRKDFPDEKIAVHVKSGYTDWLSDIIDSLALKVDYITTHTYYHYYTGKTAILDVENIERAIKKSPNPNLKYLITEGGLFTFKDYTGPSTRSIAMCTSYADYMNKLCKYEGFDSFHYYGTANQICYNDAAYGWSKKGNSAVSDYEGGVMVTGRTSWDNGAIQQIPVSVLKGQKYKFGDTLKYDISYDIKFSGSTAEPFEVKLEWYAGGQYYSTAYSKVITDYRDNVWKNISDSERLLTIPSALENKNDVFLRVTVSAAHNLRPSAFADICIKNFNLCVDSTESIVNNHINESALVGSDYTNTALASLMIMYMNGLNGDVVYTNSFNGNVCELAVKTNDGIRLFVSNLSATSDYNVVLSSLKKYTLTSRYTMYADNIEAERNAAKDEITEIVENFDDEKIISNFTIPKLSVMILELKEKAEGFTNYVNLNNNSVKIQGKKQGEGNCTLIVTPIDVNNRLLDVGICEISNDDYKFELKLPSDYNELKLFMWNIDTLEPLTPSEIYN